MSYAAYSSTCGACACEQPAHRLEHEAFLQLYSPYCALSSHIWREPHYINPFKKQATRAITDEMADYINDWYYMEPNPHGPGFVRGPFSAEEIYTLLKKGKISNSTQVRCGPNAFWHPLNAALPLITKLAVPPAPKPATPAFWQKHKTVILIAMLIAAFIVLIRHIPHSMLAGVPWLFAPKVLSTQQYAGREVLSSQAIVNLTNSVRALNGLATLNENHLLNAVAEQRARDMLEKQYFAHVSPTGEQASDLAQRTGYRYQMIAENLACGVFLTNQNLIDGWMQSPSHRKNILLPDVREIGVCAVRGRLMGENTWVFVQVFGLQAPQVSDDACVRPSQQLFNQIEIKKTELKSLHERVARLREELDSEKSSIESDRMTVGNDSRRNHDLSVKIAAYNAKSEWYNQCLVELKGKEAVANSMVGEYNRSLEAYRECHKTG